MKRYFLALLLLGTLGVLVAGSSGCSTVKGVGKDVEELGEEIQDASN